MIEYDIHYCESREKSGTIEKVTVSEAEFLDWMRDKGKDYFYVSIFRAERAGAV